MNLINLETVRTAALAALEAEGDHVYEHPTLSQGSCSYTTPDGAPSCIIGHVINRVEPEVLPAIRTKEWAKFLSTEDPEERDPFIDAFNADQLNTFRFGSENVYTWAALSWMNEAQKGQDGGALWSEAIEQADQRLRVITADNPEDAAYIASFNQTEPIATEGAAL